MADRQVRQRLAVLTQNYAGSSCWLCQNEHTMYRRPYLTSEQQSFAAYQNFEHCTAAETGLDCRRCRKPKTMIRLFTLAVSITRYSWSGSSPAILKVRRLQAHDNVKVGPRQRAVCLRFEGIYRVPDPQCLKCLRRHRTTAFLVIVSVGQCCSGSKLPRSKRRLLQKKYRQREIKWTKTVDAHTKNGRKNKGGATEWLGATVF